MTLGYSNLLHKQHLYVMHTVWNRSRNETDDVEVYGLVY